MKKAVSAIFFTVAVVVQKLLTAFFFGVPALVEFWLKRPPCPECAKLDPEQMCAECYLDKNCSGWS